MKKNYIDYDYMIKMVSLDIFSKEMSDIIVDLVSEQLNIKPIIPKQNISIVNQIEENEVFKEWKEQTEKLLKGEIKIIDNI